MNDFMKFDPLRGVSDVYAKAVFDIHKLFRLHTTIKILVVVDGGISLTESPSAFGVGRIVRLLRESHIGCTHFTVDTARRNNSTAGNPTYANFRFDQLDGAQPVLNKYHEVWCFGFNPDNNAGPDSNITQASALPTSDAELAVLTTWMNERQGGLLAIGDHDYLGASMCHRIPRIRSMRRWTNAQGVPPIGGAFNADTHLRHDTNQPATPGQISGNASIPFLNQEDAVPQKIYWVPWISQQISIFKIQTRPHPILCHPVHGPIDVMPDHPHEGWCFEDHEIDLTAPLSIPSLSGQEYPTVGSNQPRPTVIAHGTTTPNPPFNLDKGASPKKRFAMVSVYDGHPANVGRVSTDSTWHHWFDENIQDIEAAGGANWDKISRYYLNTAKWLAPPGVADWCFAYEVLVTHFTYLGHQEYSRKAHVFELGKHLHAHLVRHLGPCWVTQWVFDRLQLVDSDFHAWLKDRLFWKNGIPVPKGDPCFSCPPFELIEIAVLGGLVQTSFPIADEIRAMVEKNPEAAPKLKAEAIVKRQLEGVALGIKALRSSMARSVKEMQALVG
jgi:hypothetical protein